MIRRLLSLFTTRTDRVGGKPVTTDDEWHIWDSEDGGEPCAWRATCATCGGGIYYQDCPTGGWWIHDQHPADGHDAEPLAAADDAPLPDIDPVLAERMRVEIVATAQAEAAARFGRSADAMRRAYLAAQAQRDWQAAARDAIDSRPPFPGCGCGSVPDNERTPPLTADELDAEVAAYERGAAERARRAGVTWPVNVPSVGIARYGKDGQR